MRITRIARLVSLLAVAVLLVTLSTAAGASDPIVTNDPDASFSLASEEVNAVLEKEVTAEVLAQEGIEFQDAATATEEDFTSEKLVYINVPAAAFINDGYNDEADFFNSFSGARLDGKKKGLYGTICFSAPVYLPPGTRVTKLEAWFKDNVSGQAYLRLYNRYVVTNTVTEMAKILTVNRSAITKYADTTIADPWMNNNTAFYLGTCISPGQSFYGARIQLTK